jgi:site-specific DNA-adenine methylase
MHNKVKLVSSISYQGGKQRIAPQILDHIKPEGNFYDLCCGSGAISIELVNRNYDVNQITMLDAGPWGLFWKMIGNGSFSLKEFEHHLGNVPKDISLIQSYIKELSKNPAYIDTVYVFLLLQASSFGGKSIWISDNKWRNCSFRNYWLPTATSSRRSHVNPMMPMPDTLFERIVNICEKMQGVNGIYGDINDFVPGEGIVYIDPPYSKTTLYGFNFDLMDYIKKIGKKCYVSEGKKLSENSILIAGKRAKGGISGDRKNFNEEWLSEIF